MSEDLRTPIAKARDNWLESAEGLHCLEDSILSYRELTHYLRNRLQLAFQAGWNTRDEHDKGKDDQQQLFRIVLPDPVPVPGIYFLFWDDAIGYIGESEKP